MACESEQLKELALYAGEPDTYCYIDSTDGEYFPFRGGNWSSGAGAGVFCTVLHHPRSSVDTASASAPLTSKRKTENWKLEN